MCPIIRTFKSQTSIIKIAFPLRVDGAVLRGRQIGQQLAGFRVPAEEDLGVGCGVKGRVIGAARLVERDVARPVALFGCLLYTSPSPRDEPE